MQGQRLLTYGGERAVAPEGRPEGGEDDEDATETVGDASLLDADARCWAPLTLAGVCTRAAELSCVITKAGACQFRDLEVRLACHPAGHCVIYLCASLGAPCCRPSTSAFE